MAMSAGVSKGPMPKVRFSWGGDFQEGYAPVQVDGKFGFIDTLGALAIGPSFEYAGAFSGRLAPALIDGKWGYIDVTGRIIIPPVYDWAGPFNEGLAPVETAGGRGFIDTLGAEVGGFRYQDARPYSGGYAAVRIGDGEWSAWGFVDRTGNLAIPPLFADVMGGFSEGFAAVRVDLEMPYRSGFIDSSGGFAIDTLYDAAGDFHEGLAPVGRGEWRGNRFTGSWGYVDTTGRLKTPLAYSYAGAFRGGRAQVRRSGGGNAIIARDGRVLQEFREDLQVLPADEGGVLTFKLRNLYGFMDPATGGVIGPHFAEAGVFRGGWARVRLTGAGSGGWAYIGKDGRFLGVRR